MLERAVVASRAQPDVDQRIDLATAPVPVDVGVDPTNRSPCLECLDACADGVGGQVHLAADLLKGRAAVCLKHAQDPLVDVINASVSAVRARAQLANFWRRVHIPSWTGLTFVSRRRAAARSEWPAIAAPEN